MGKIIQNGNILRIAEIEKTFEKLPIGVYNLGLDNSGYFLTETSEFSLPNKIYGDMSIVDRCVKTYESKKRNVGILLSGLKGGGKTVTAKLLANKVNKPIINISAPYAGPDFIDFITNPILGECVIFLDEYEKIYSSNKRDSDGNDSLLSLLDGPYETHHLFIFTVNEPTINSNLINRPSRILYSKEYHGLSQEDVTEIAEDILDDKIFMEDLIMTCNKIYQLSFDILISIIDEVNRFHEPASKCIEFMNLTPRQTYFNIKQWYVNDEGCVDFDYAGWGIPIEYDDDGNMFVNANYSHFITYPNGNKRKYNNSVNINMNDVKKVNNNTYEVFLKEYNSLFTLTENTTVSYGYTKTNNIYKPKNVTEELLNVYIDEKNNYVKHTPSCISLDAVKKIIGTHYFEKNSSSDDLGIECSEDLCSNDCGDCCR